jgi:hypothetical protein
MVAHHHGDKGRFLQRGQHSETLFRPHIPHAQVAVQRGGDQQRVVLRHGEGRYRLCVACESDDDGRERVKGDEDVYRSR